MQYELRRPLRQGDGTDVLRVVRKQQSRQTDTNAACERRNKGRGGGLRKAANRYLVLSDSEISCHSGDRGVGAAAQERAYEARHNAAAVCRADLAANFPSAAILRGDVPCPLAEGFASADNCAKHSLGPSG